MSWRDGIQGEARHPDHLHRAQPATQLNRAACNPCPGHSDTDQRHLHSCQGTFQGDSYKIQLKPDAN